MVNQQAAENYNFSIYHDDVDGAQQITRHLIQLGHKKIAYLGNVNSGKTTLDRLKGFQSEMEAHSFSVPADYIYHVAGGESELGFSAMAYFLNLHEPPTALICYNDLLAMGVLRYCSEQGIQVPQHFSLVGFDNISYSAYTTPSLTTFDQPKRELGNQASRLLLNLLSSDETGLQQYQQIQILTGKLLVRESTAAPRATEERDS
jgi:DNA-binding LacI/PurR family transcriptional regulator